jgi:hypothetical protein
VVPTGQAGASGEQFDDENRGFDRVLKVFGEEQQAPPAAVFAFSYPHAIMTDASAPGSCNREWRARDGQVDPDAGQ